MDSNSKADAEMNRIGSNNSITDHEIDHDELETETSEFLWKQKELPSMRNLTGAKRLRDFLPAVGIAIILLFSLAICEYYYNHNRRFDDPMMTEQQLLHGTTNGSVTKGTVLVTGATGRLGALLYKTLQRRGETVRAFVRDADKARTALGCSSCDETEGIYLGDVTNPDDLRHAMADGTVTTLAVAIGASPSDDKATQKAVEFDSVVESVRALGLSSSSSKDRNLSVVFCSSMGTEKTGQSWSGDILHWKLNAEAFLATSGIPVTIVKPCGLLADMAGKNSTLVVGHHGSIMENTDHHTVSREDVASVMAEAVDLSKDCHFHRNNNLRFDLCSKPGPATTDLRGLLESTRWEWDRPGV